MEERAPASEVGDTVKVEDGTVANDTKDTSLEDKMKRLVSHFTAPPYW